MPIRPTAAQVQAAMALYEDLSPDELTALLPVSQAMADDAFKEYRAGGLSRATVLEAMADLFAVRGLVARLSGGLL